MVYHGFWMCPQNHVKEILLHVHKEWVGAITCSLTSSYLVSLWVLWHLLKSTQQDDQKINSDLPDPNPVASYCSHLSRRTLLSIEWKCLELPGSFLFFFLIDNWTLLCNGVTRSLLSSLNPQFSFLKKDNYISPFVAEIYNCNYTNVVVVSNRLMASLQWWNGEIKEGISLES